MSKIVQVRPLGSYRIWLRFSDGAQGEVDLSDLAGRGVFAPWTDPDVFAAVRVENCGGIEWPGEIDMSNVEALRRKIEPIVARAPERVIFDLSALSFMDSSGIALLLQVSAKSKTVRVRHPSPLVKRMIDATGLTDILVVEQ